MEWWEQQRKDFCLFFQHQADQSTFWRSQRKAARKKLEGKERVVTGIVFERTGEFLWALKGFPGGSVVKNPPANAGDTGHMGSIPGLGRSPGGGKGNPLQYSSLENPMDRGAWRATVHGVPQSQTWLSTPSEPWSSLPGHAFWKLPGYISHLFPNHASAFCPWESFPLPERLTRAFAHPHFDTSSFFFFSFSWVPDTSWN